MGCLFWVSNIDFFKSFDRLFRFYMNFNEIDDVFMHCFATENATCWVPGEWVTWPHE